MDIYSFLTFKKVEIIEKADPRAHNFDFKWQFHPNIVSTNYDPNDHFQAHSGVKFNNTSRKI